MTCWTASGTSLVDYCVCSLDLFDIDHDFQTGTTCESDHLLIESTFQIKTSCEKVDLYDNKEMDEKINDYPDSAVCELPSYGIQE